ncbi:TPA: hypothetical protein SMO99_001395 [Proteus mirabilis]|nr:hypothetical protein [Proteus mirabilis]HEJ9452806.1 hypothetical protein [Proteus mirabilis]HEJ9464435.1 hypothetical protein [Proteus mirabilis]HEJ9566852.1 hypothetical protein [Proteus mirabilis]HEJ9623486.1 hypothetical protein [Proteus mirabilis]
MFDASLLNLPWATLVTLTSGYIGYFIANVGLKEHHKPIEVTFSSLIFGLLSMMVYQAVMWSGLNAWLATPPALLCAFICGVFWRRYGRKWMYKFLRDKDISWSDNTHSAWQRMFDQHGYYISEGYVYLKDGTVLLSEHPGHFEGQPGGAFVLGAEKDVLMYVTHEKKLGNDKWLKKEVANKNWGVMATYIPADQIAMIRIRRTRNRIINSRSDETD